MHESIDPREEKARKVAELRQVIARHEWHAAQERCVETGWDSLDALLPGGGWPRGTLSECVGPPGGGSLTVPLCAAARLTRAGMLVALVDAVGDFHGAGAHALGVCPSSLCVVRPPSGRRSVWSAEQLARSGRFSLVLLHRETPLGTHESRMLRLAAEVGDAAVVLIGCAGRQPPGIASLRVRVAACAFDALEVEVVRARGGAPGGRLSLPWPLGSATAP